MTSLRTDLDHYLQLRRRLGHELADAARLLPVTSTIWSSPNRRRSPWPTRWRGRSNRTPHPAVRCGRGG